MAQHHGASKRSGVPGALSLAAARQDAEAESHPLAGRARHPLQADRLPERATREGEIRKLLVIMQDDLAPGVTVSLAFDATRALLTVEAYSLLVTERDWTPEHIRSRPGDLLGRHLLS
jgi:hypothetical protein